MLHFLDAHYFDDGLVRQRYMSEPQPWVVRG